MCAACGFDGAGYSDAAVLDALRALGPTWQALITSGDAALTARPGPDVWSAMEYAAHTRDILAVHAFGVEQALTVDEPSYPEFEDDLIETAAASYAASDPREVADGLTESATRLARLADDAGPSAWSRGLTIGDHRSEVRRLLEHALHDALHHVDDVERGLAQLHDSATGSGSG